MIEIQQAAAAIYLAAGIGALLALVLPSPRMSRGAVWGLALGAIVQSFAFATLHRLNPPPALTDLRVVLGLVSWMSVVVLLLFIWRMRLASLAAVVGPIAFVTVFSGSLQSPSGVAVASVSGTWPHASSAAPRVSHRSNRRVLVLIRQVSILELLEDLLRHRVGATLSRQALRHPLLQLPHRDGDHCSPNNDVYLTK